MKKVTQILRSTRNTAIIVIVLGMATTLFGCTSAGPTDPSTESLSSISKTKDSPFNTLEDAEGWGNEADFLRIGDASESDTEIQLPDPFEGEFKLKAKGVYMLAIRIHNTSDKEQSGLALTIAHPETIKPEDKNQVSATLSWGGENPGLIVDQIGVKSQECLITKLPSSADGDGNVVISDGSGKQCWTKPMSATMEGTTSHIITLDSIGSVAPDEVYTVFFFFGTFPDD